MVNHEISICDPLTSQGIRGVRFAAEIEGVTRVLISDINEHAYQLAKHNVVLNRLEEKITVKHKDANAVLSCNASPKKRFDIVDIDPFGTPAPFLDSAFRAIRNNGLVGFNSNRPCATVWGTCESMRSKIWRQTVANGVLP